MNNQNTNKMENQDTTTQDLMENQVKTMTMEEIKEFFMREKTPEEKEQEKLEMEKHFKESMDQFIETHDYMEKPSLQTRQAGAWTRENILLDSWNQYINWEARMSEHMGMHPEGKGFRYLNNTRRCDLALGFAHYFLASMEEQVKIINEEYPESLK